MIIFSTTMTCLFLAIFSLLICSALPTGKLRSNNYDIIITSCQFLLYSGRQTKNPEDYRLTFRDPPDCFISKCDIFVAIDTNAGDPAFLDIYLEGTAQGWVAVGFTDTPSMVSSHL